MKSLEEQIRRRCVHFTGLMTSKSCSAGVAYLTVHNKELPGTRGYPCFRENESVPCQHRRFPTDEEATTEANERREQSKKTTAAMTVAMEDAKSRGLGVGKGGKGHIACPVCSTGRLFYSVAALNGHLWGQCSTPNCVSWMM